MQITQKLFGKMEEKEIIEYTLKNNQGMEVSCLNYGGIVTRVIVPNKEGKLENVVLNYASLDEYLNDTYYFGALIGRVAGRIKGATFELNGKTHSLEINDNRNNLHGGKKGFNRVIWDTELLENEEEVAIKLMYHSPDGEEGFPGNINVEVLYTLNNHNEWKISYKGNSDEQTILNMTNHTYFNLSGNAKRDILQHQMQLKSDKVLELDQELLPTGEWISVENTPFDFQERATIEKGVLADHEQTILAGNGYDHPFLLNAHNDQEIQLIDEESGRILTIETEEEGVVIYSGNQMEEKGMVSGVPCRKYLGICLETQGLPDAIHHSAFRSWVIDKDRPYQTETVYRFDVIK
ncbi:aldose epimerase family protein [Bacillus sp. B1-b2]|uniref:aldose epimerase family protein n=1 Tax=Bacillus sp. B1-b2 TaxID=2653201 RepID=UPI001261809E|nr:aldose epimerase family protein [Bacillus sp. B1-b2]KAB7667631.1 galactose mutarotase [Bacillus sp. B1-b2]